MNKKALVLSVVQKKQLSPFSKHSVLSRKNNYPRSPNIECCLEKTTLSVLQTQCVTQKRQLSPFSKHSVLPRKDNYLRSPNIVCCLEKTTISVLQTQCAAQKTTIFVLQTQCVAQKRHIESNTGKSARQGNLRHPKIFQQIKYLKFLS